MCFTVWCPYRNLNLQYDVGLGQCFEVIDDVDAKNMSTQNMLVNSSTCFHFSEKRLQITSQCVPYVRWYAMAGPSFYLTLYNQSRSFPALISFWRLPKPYLIGEWCRIEWLLRLTYISTRESPGRACALSRLQTTRALSCSLSLAHINQNLLTR